MKLAHSETAIASYYADLEGGLQVGLRRSSPGTGCSMVLHLRRISNSGAGKVSNAAGA